MNARRYPRTLEEAFGPYTSRVIEQEPEKTPAHEIALYIVAVIAVLVIVVTIVLESV